MPCNSDYMMPHSAEIQMSQVACVLDELRGTRSWSKSDWEGYHPRVYGMFLSKTTKDEMVEQACTTLQAVTDVRDYSLEVQMWWRDHQEADRQRILKELQDKTDDELREAARAKLTDYERQLLGV